MLVMLEMPALSVNTIVKSSASGSVTVTCTVGLVPSLTTIASPGTVITGMRLRSRVIGKLTTGTDGSLLLITSTALLPTSSGALAALSSNFTSRLSDGAISPVVSVLSIFTHGEPGTVSKHERM